MTKYLLISIHPQHVKNILTGKKTLELRKMIPKWVFEAITKGETVKALIYCTKAEPYLYQDYAINEDGYTYLSGYGLTDWKNEGFIVNGKVVAQFEINKIDKYFLETPNGHQITYLSDLPFDNGASYSLEIKRNLLSKSCLSFEKTFEYGTKRSNGLQSVVNAIHISNLKVFDKPKELGDYYKDFAYSDTDEYGRQHNPTLIPLPLERAPQSMQKVWGDE